MVETSCLEAKGRFREIGSCETVPIDAHTKHDLKAHLVWIPTYRRKVLTGPAAIRAGFASIDSSSNVFPSQAECEDAPPRSDSV